MLDPSCNRIIDIFKSHLHVLRQHGCMHKQGRPHSNNGIAVGEEPSADGPTGLEGAQTTLSIGVQVGTQLRVQGLVACVEIGQGWYQGS